MKYKLGKKPARPGAVKFKFANYVDKSKLPTPPKSFGHVKLPSPWGMLANDQVGDCVIAGAAHETMAWNYMGSGTVPRFTDESILRIYSELTGYNPSDPNSDQGTDMSAAADYRRRTGIPDADGKIHKIDSYLDLSAGDVDNLVLGAYLGGVGVGLMLPDDADKMFDNGQVWDMKAGFKANPDNGHYVPVLGRNSAGNLLLITWGRLHAMTPRFYEMCSDEAIAYLSLESIAEATSKNPEGFDIATLRKDLAALA